MLISFHIRQGLARRAAFAILLAALPFEITAAGLSFDEALTRALREAPSLAANAAQIDAPARRRFRLDSCLILNLC